MRFIVNIKQFVKIKMTTNLFLISLWKCAQLGNIQAIVIINNVSQSCSCHNINFWEEKKQEW